MDATALSNVIAYSAQAMVLAAVATLAHAALRVHAPSISYGYWRVVLVACIVFPWLHARRQPDAAVGSVADNIVTTGAAAPAETVVPTADAWNIEWAPIVLGVLIAGIVVRLIWLGLGFARLRRLRDAGRSAGPGESYEELQRLLGTKAQIRLVPDLAMPVTFGLLHPVVLLPSTMAERPDAVQTAIATHELLHVQRRDWMWHLLEEGVRAVFWFNPAIWWAVAQIDLAREAVVDEVAVRVTGRRRTYLEALLTFADDDSALPVAAFARRRHLFVRMQSLSRETVMSSRRIVLSSALLGIALISGTFGAASAFPLVAAGGEPQASLGVAPGALEQRAMPVSAENPVPKRTQYEAPDYPAEARVIGLSGSVTLRLTLDEFGRVAEARPTGVSFDSNNRSTRGSFDKPSPADLQALMERNLGADKAREMMAALEAFAASGIRAVQQWRYEPPAKSPMFFDVTLFFKQDGETSAAAPRLGSVGRVALQSASGQAPVRVGGTIKTPIKTHHVPPVYPPEAQAARVSGMVIVEALVGADGAVENARVLRSIPLLDDAAVNAVLQWRFTPTLLNGQAVPVLMTVTVNFTLQ